MRATTLRYRRDLFHRWEGNPALRHVDLPFPCLDVRNAGAVKVGDRYILLITIEALDGRARIFRAESSDGYDFEVDSEPVLAPTYVEPYFVYELNGVEDPRVTLLEGTYYVTYTANSPLGLRLAIAKTTDFRTFDRIGLVSQPDVKHGVLFPERIGGRYARLERPREGGSIWVSYSDDLLYWGSSAFVMGPRGGYWDFHRVGPSTAPVRVDEGWLIIYYGVKATSAGPLFRLGAAVLDAENPAIVKGRTDIPVLAPREDYERIGDVNNLVFSCGAIVEDGAMRLYYGGSDSCICVGEARIKTIVDRCLDGNGENH
jgi:beta-1,4-mannooligosaccharide/beta-1,4-mannosyl-N-acetylglucosamine phosphorylase